MSAHRPSPGRRHSPCSTTWRCLFPTRPDPNSAGTARHLFHHKSKARHIDVTKWVYFFGAGKAEGDGTWRDLLGGKGAGLAEMTKIGLPVPAGFTISTDACDYYYKNGKKYPGELKKQLAENVAKLEKAVKK